LEKEKKSKVIFVKFAPKRSAPKWTSNKMGNNKRATTKQVAPKWLHHKVVYPLLKAQTMLMVIILDQYILYKQILAQVKKITPVLR